MLSPDDPLLVVLDVFAGTPRPPFGVLNMLCEFMAGMSNDGGERMEGNTGGEPMSGDMPNEAFPGCPEPFCCCEATPRPPPLTVRANIEMSNDGSKSSSCNGLSLDLNARLLSIDRSRPPPFILLAKSRESRDSQSSTDLLFDEPLIDAASDLASDSWSRTGLNRSSRN